MSEAPLEKKITFENNQLLCNGKPISIEDAEILVQEQIRTHEDETANLVKTVLDFEVKSIEMLADSVNYLRYQAGMNSIAGRGLEEYKSVADDILRALAIVNRALSLFSKKRLKKPKENAPRSNFKPEDWPLNINKDPDYEPTLDEVFEKYHELMFQELIYHQFRSQFHSAEIKVEKEHIAVFGNLINEFRVYIKNNDIHIFFQINENDGSFGDIHGNYVSSGLKVGAISLQNTRETFLKHGNNNFKSAQTIDNLITKQIRFLKNTVKQEINFSLEQNISRAEDRLNIANILFSNYRPLLDKKTRSLLNSIIKEAKKTIREQKPKNVRTRSMPVEGQNEINQINETDRVNMSENDILSGKKLVEEEVKKQLLFAFETSEDKIRFETRQKEDFLLFDALIAGQRININIYNYKKVFVSGTNTTGTGKTDFQQVEVQGNDLKERIKNAAYMSALPLLYRQIENLSANIRGSEPKKIFKKIESHLKEIPMVISDFSVGLPDKILVFTNNLTYILDNISGFNKQIIEDLFNILDKLLKKINEVINESTELIINEKIINLAEIKKGLRQIYQLSVPEDNNIAESLNEVKKYAFRIINSNVIIKELNDFKKLLFEKQNIANEAKEILRSRSEDSIKLLADNLSEDAMIGGIARKVLGLMEASISSRDDMFKYNLENIIMEIIKLR